MTDLTQLASDLLLAHKNDSAAAFTAFLARIKKDEALREAVADDCWRRHVKAALAMPHDNLRGTKEGPRRKPMKMPTEEQRKAAVTVMRLTVLDTYQVLDGRKIGDVLFAELRDLAWRNGSAGAEFLRRGLRDVREAFLCGLIRQYATPANENATVRDVIKPSDLQAKLDEATRLAHEFVSAASRREAEHIVAAAFGSEPAPAALR